ncbi:uncharacterized protein LOC111869139 [Cryptotermes secundus]|uniref:uncharacterized protein LOC111869139 n=1 Tax=Cryptotermes secundus TaxID=105785 RepID=UPI000CD7C378|nr:uncharacterized protein LOC111869139 [Cryptotermes secundus]
MAIEMTSLVNTLVLFFFTSFIGSVLCAPAVTEETVYDQRQNGTENIRVHIKGVVIVHAPLEALAALASVPGVSEEVSLEQQLTEILSGTSSTTETGLVQPLTEAEISNSSKPEGSKPAAPSANNTAAPTEVKPLQGQSQTLPKKTRPRLKLSNLLMPLLRRL